MDLIAVVRMLKKHEADLKKMGIKRLYVFGSTARGEQKLRSDVDLFFDYDPGSVSLFDYVHIKRETSNIIGCKADIISRDSINHLLRPRAEAEAIPVF